MSSAAEVVLREVNLLSSSPDASLESTWKDLGLDSLDLFTLVTAVEEATGRAITDAQLAKTFRVQDLVDAVS